MSYRWQFAVNQGGRRQDIFAREVLAAHVEETRDASRADIQFVHRICTSARVQVEDATKLDELARVRADDRVEERRRRGLATNAFADVNPCVGCKVEPPEVAEDGRERDATEKVYS
jgi:hypothetical protein